MIFAEQLTLRWQKVIGVAAISCLVLTVVQIFFQTPPQKCCRVLLEILVLAQTQCVTSQKEFVARFDPDSTATDLY